MAQQLENENWNLYRVNDYRLYLDIPDRHGFELTHNHFSSDKIMDCDAYEFMETDRDGRLVATYQVWHKFGKRPPFRGRHHYRRFDAQGMLIEGGLLD